jgi:hypothetical protein
MMRLVPVVTGDRLAGFILKSSLRNPYAIQDADAFTQIRL